MRMIHATGISHPILNATRWDGKKCLSNSSEKDGALKCQTVKHRREGKTVKCGGEGELGEIRPSLGYGAR